ncbi:MAG: hypothetical protein RIA65_06660 [Woeseia sp.]
MLTAVLFAVLLSGCGGESAEVADASPAPAPEQSVETFTVDLPTSAIDLSTAHAPNSALDAAVPVCPWLADASAVAAVDPMVGEQPMQRRRVTADECTWNINLGFAVSIKTTPLASAPDLSKITYNMDVPPVVQVQDGPGDAAVALLDPTWDESNPRLFGFVFQTDDRQFRIITTGVNTSFDRLRSVADEIVAALPVSTPIAAGNGEPTLDACVYDVETLAILFTGAPDNAIKVTANPANSGCSYRGYAGSTRVNLSIGFSGDPFEEQTDAGPDFVPLAGFASNVYVYDQSELVGERNSLHGYVIERPSGKFRLDLQVNNPDFPEETAAKLLNNLIARTN